MKILNLYAGIGGNRMLWGNEHEITAVENVQNPYDDLLACEQELIRTRKALDAALNCLNGVVKDLPWVKRTLAEITALEQKE